MIHLKQNDLTVSILDPIQDQARLGSRYCVGGYIWQVYDEKWGDLFSGPKYPDPNPSGFDGQGCPEIFEIALGQDKAEIGGEVYVVGVGRVRRDSPVKPFHVRNNFTVLEFAKWAVEESTSRVTMKSREICGENDLDLIRSVSLEGRILVSKTTVENKGTLDLPLRWFAHPFFPLAGWESTRFSVDCDLIRYLADSGGFKFNQTGNLERIPEFDWTKGCYQLLNLPFGYPMEFFQKHPTLGEVKVECRFPLAFMPAWANDRTISIEPFHHTILAPGAKTEWSIRYGF